MEPLVLVALLLGLAASAGAAIGRREAHALRDRRAILRAKRFDPGAAKDGDRVVVSGIVVRAPHEAPLTSPIEERACVAYQVNVTRYRERSTEPVLRHAEARAFFVDLGGVTARITPDRASALRMQLRADAKHQTRWERSTPPRVEAFLKQHGVPLDEPALFGAARSREYQVTEAFLTEGTRVLVVGTLLWEADPDGAFLPPDAGYRGPPRRAKRPHLVSRGPSAPLLITDAPDLVVHR